MGLDARDIMQWVHRERDLRNYEQRAGEFCQIMKACVDLHINPVGWVIKKRKSISAETAVSDSL